MRFPLKFCLQILIRIKSTLRYQQQICSRFAGFVLLALVYGCAHVTQVDENSVRSDLEKVEALMMDRQFRSAQKYLQDLVTQYPSLYRPRYLLA